MRHRRSRVRISSRAVYGVMGWTCGMAVALLVYFALKPDEWMLVCVPLSTMALALWYGEWTGKVPTAAEANRPITLFAEQRSTKKQ